MAAIASKATGDLWKAWKQGRELKIKPSIYAHEAVKSSLRAAQHDKCAYCETLNPTSHEVVEHYRPKMGCRQVRTDPLLTPHYFWLAYDWNNLLFACDRCNDSGHKQNLFPLQDPSTRASAANVDTRRENPLLINPFGRIDPEKHIEWSRDVPRPRNGSRKGKASIETFGLVQDSLLLRRRKKYLDDTERMLALAESLPKSDSRRGIVRPVFLDHISAAGPWSAMIRANLGSRISAL